MKVRDVIKLIEKAGWYYIGSTGSHKHYKHPSRPGKVTVPGKRGDELAPGTLNSIMKQAGLK